MKTAIAVTTVLVLLGGAFAGINAYFAKAKDLNLVELRLDQKILDDRYNSIRERIWSLEDKYGDMCKNAPPREKNEYRKLLLDLKRIERALEKQGVKK